MLEFQEMENLLSIYAIGKSSVTEQATFQRGVSNGVLKSSVLLDSILLITLPWLFELTLPGIAQICIAAWKK